MVSRLLIQAMARSFGLESDIEIGFTAAENPEITSANHDSPVQRLLRGEVDLVEAGLDSKLSAVESGKHGPAAVLPGSFNPLHEGHIRLAAVAREMTGMDPVYELAVLNVDKPPLEEEEVLRRVAGIHMAGIEGRAPVALTRTPTFRLKARIFPGSVFVIGWDTLVRLIDPLYYGDSETDMLTALAEIWAQGCRFLVAGRQNQGSFRTLEEVPVPQGFQPLFQAIPEEEFRADISSTELRESGG